MAAALRRGDIRILPTAWGVQCPTCGWVVTGLDEDLARFAARSHRNAHRLDLELPPIGVHEGKLPP